MLYLAETMHIPNMPTTVTGFSHCEVGAEFKAWVHSKSDRIYLHLHRNTWQDLQMWRTTQETLRRGRRQKQKYSQIWLHVAVADEQPGGLGVLLKSNEITSKIHFTMLKERRAKSWIFWVAFCTLANMVVLCALR